MKRLVPTIFILAAIVMAACGTGPLDRALSSGGLGAAGGAVVGAIAGGPVVGAALIGTAAGAALEAVAARVLDDGAPS